METIKTIETEAQYRIALKEIDRIIDSEHNSSEFLNLETLSILVDNYENKYYFIEPLGPVEAINV